MSAVNESVFTKVDLEAVDGVLYQAMFDEVIRLRTCLNRKERESIRRFLTEAYQQIATKGARISRPEPFQEALLPR